MLQNIEGGVVPSRSKVMPRILAVLSERELSSEERPARATAAIDLAFPADTRAAELNAVLDAALSGE